MPRSKVGKALTKARGPVHGNFAEGATITQGILALLQGGSSWPRMSAAKKEAVHMIVHKLHRIVTGNPDHKDHWDDIGGYGQLGADDCVEATPVKKRRTQKAKLATKIIRNLRKEKVAKPQAAVPKKKAVKTKVTARPQPVRAVRAGRQPQAAVRVPRARRPVLNGAAPQAGA